MQGVYVMILGEYAYPMLQRMDNTNKTQGGEELVEAFRLSWSIFVNLGTVLYFGLVFASLLPLARRKNYTSLPRRRLMFTNALIFMLGVVRIVTLRIVDPWQRVSMDVGLICLWGFGSLCWAVAQTIFLYILKSTACLQTMSWKTGYSLGIAAVVLLHVAMTAAPALDLCVSRLSQQQQQHDASSIAHSLLPASIMLKACFCLITSVMFVQSTCRMQRNSASTLRLVKQTRNINIGKPREVIVADVRNFKTMTREIYLLAVLEVIYSCCLCTKSIVAFANPRLIVNDVTTVWLWLALELTCSTCEVIVAVIIILLAFFSAKHRQELNRWVRRFSLREDKSVSVDDALTVPFRPPKDHRRRSTTVDTTSSDL